MKKITTQDWIELAIIAAMYVVLTTAIAPFSYGIINFRVSEVLMMLPFFNHKYSISLIAGCFIANLFSPMGMPDIIFGTLATTIVCIIIMLISKSWLVPIIAAVVNGIIIGIELNLVLKLPLWASIGSVALGEVIIMIIGWAIFYFAMRNKQFNKLVMN
ncbi:membrane protein [Companilactobacillus sp. RD055328]|uniref:QueT transporter family protein n=1 Tax=Companilactobacillus sp. RD055328 TaxID=2916634 RepID=UPI001FC88021|nr:QueT transporter family protein [Companilactobacillus sp. RD055328]GKQ42459.1 membrane protein [Companilactobacillus sp. RD055328]